MLSEKRIKILNTALDNYFEPDNTKKYNRKDLFQLLKSGSDKEKQFAALEIPDIKSAEEAEDFVSNLVGQDGKIREAVAFKLNEYMNSDCSKEFLTAQNLFPTLFKGIMDINGNVCRYIITANWSKEFEQYLCKILPEKINHLLQKIENLSADEKQYKISKRNFQLYWALEALYKISDKVNLRKYSEILQKTADFEDYTIREKTAKILTKTNDKKFEGIINKLKNDKNYYVRRFLAEN